jgi:protein-S-isoprenylcysteine O-methyltransferase Ste14
MFLFLALAGAASWLLPWQGGLRIVWLGIALVVVGLAISQSAFFLFRSEGTEIMPDSETNTKLVVRGAYRFTRNPMYLGLTILSLGVAFWVGTPPMFAVPVLLFAVCNQVHIPFEEAKMRRQFGAAFDDYTRKVRRWI